MFFKNNKRRAVLNGISVILTSTLLITESRVGRDGTFFSVRYIAISNPGS